jgi:hypothetical protein
MTRVLNPNSVSWRGRQQVAAWWAAHIYMTVNYGLWSRNTTPLELDTGEGLIDLSRAAYPSGTSTAERGSDARGGVLQKHFEFALETTAGHLVFSASIDMATYDWTAMLKNPDLENSAIAQLVRGYMARDPRYHARGLRNARNPDYGSKLHTGARATSPYISEPDLEDSAYGAQLWAWSHLPMIFRCVAYSETLRLPHEFNLSVNDSSNTKGGNDHGA